MQPLLPLQREVKASHLLHVLTRVGENWSRMNNCTFPSPLPTRIITASAASISRCMLCNSAREDTDPSETSNSYFVGIFQNFNLL